MQASGNFYIYRVDLHPDGTGVRILLADRPTLQEAQALILGWELLPNMHYSVTDRSQQKVVWRYGSNQYIRNAAEIRADQEWNESIGLKEYRKDGWPLCPQCGEDELYSLPEGQRAMALIRRSLPIQVYIDNGMRCYLCDWSSPARPTD